ncbi:hypothetical protein AAZV13_09G233600 [Glycine max]
MISGILINYITAIAGPHPVDLIITKERTIRDNFTVTDVNGNIVFTVQSSLITFVTPCQHLFLLDAYENPLCIYAERNCYNLVLCSVASIISQPCNVGFLATFNGIIHLSHLWIHYLSLSVAYASFYLIFNDIIPIVVYSLDQLPLCPLGSSTGDGASLICCYGQQMIVEKHLEEEVLNPRI